MTRAKTFAFAAVAASSFPSWIPALSSPGAPKTLASRGADRRSIAIRAFRRFHMTHLADKNLRGIERDADAALDAAAARWGLSSPAPARAIDLEVRVGGRASDGRTIFRGGQVDRLTLAGTAQEIRSAVLPHEILHVLFFSHFAPKTPPLWALEGAAIAEEPLDRQAEMEELLDRIGADGLMPVRRLLSEEHDAKNSKAAWVLYAQGYSVSRYLMRLGRRKFIDFLERAMDSGDWDASLKSMYGIRDCEALGAEWQKWRSTLGSAPAQEAKLPQGVSPS